MVLQRLVGQTIPELCGKLSDLAFCVPIFSASVFAVLLHGRKVLNIMTSRGSEAGFGGVLKNILDVTDDRAASCDFENRTPTFTFRARTWIVPNDHFTNSYFLIWQWVRVLHSPHGLPRIIPPWTGGPHKNTRREALMLESFLFQVNLRTYWDSPLRFLSQTL